MSLRIVSGEEGFQLHQISPPAIINGEPDDEGKPASKVPRTDDALERANELYEEERRLIEELEGDQDIGDGEVLERTS